MTLCLGRKGVRGRGWRVWQGGVEENAGVLIVYYSDDWRSAHKRSDIQTARISSITNAVEIFTNYKSFMFPDNLLHYRWTEFRQLARFELWAGFGLARVKIKSGSRRSWVKNMIRIRVDLGWNSDQIANEYRLNRISGFWWVRVKYDPDSDEHSNKHWSGFCKLGSNYDADSGDHGSNYDPDQDDHSTQFRLNMIWILLSRVRAMIQIRVNIKQHQCPACMQQAYLE